MEYYRRYRAVFPFSARSDTELSMSSDDTLLVKQQVDGSWPSSEKWMQGYNEITECKGEFPAGAYVEFLEEFEVEPEPPPLPPVAIKLEAPPFPPGPPMPSPRHHAVQPIPTESSNDDHLDPDSNKQEGRKQEEAPPPPPPRPGRLSESNRSQALPQAPPRPAPRKKNSEAENRINGMPPSTPTHLEPDVGSGHKWVNVTFRIPVLCVGCKSQ